MNTNNVVKASSTSELEIVNVKLPSITKSVISANSAYISFCSNITMLFLSVNLTSNTFVPVVALTLIWFIALWLPYIVSDTVPATADIVDVYYYLDTGTDCPSCVYDPINKESVNPDCPECGGIGKIIDELKKTIDATVGWRGISDEYERVRIPGGTLNQGDAVISCKLTDALINSADLTSATYFDIANYIMVNSRKCVLMTTPHRYGLAGDLYRCAAVVKLAEE